MAALDPLGGEGPQRGEVGGEADRGHHLAELGAAIAAEDLQCEASDGVGSGGSTDHAYGHGEAHRAHEPALVVLAPGGERAVATVASRIRVGAGLHRAPVVARGQYHGVDPVHDALVVGRRAVGVELGEARGRDDAIDHLRA